MGKQTAQAKEIYCKGYNDTRRYKDMELTYMILICSHEKINYP